MKPTMIIGIDPGSTGGMCFMAEDSTYFPSLESGCFACNLPKTTPEVRDILNQWIEDWMAETNYQGETFFYLETPAGMPFRPNADGKMRQGIGSSMKFSRSIGRLEGLLIGMDVKYTFVTPQKWMKALNCQTKGDKKITYRFAHKLYPHLKPTHKTADAILICHYGVQDVQNRKHPEESPKSIRPKARRSTR